MSCYYFSQLHLGIVSHCMFPQISNIIKDFARINNEAVKSVIEKPRGLQWQSDHSSCNQNKCWRSWDAKESTQLITCCIWRDRRTSSKPCEGTILWELNSMRSLIFRWRSCKRENNVSLSWREHCVAVSASLKNQMQCFSSGCRK
jgi:hypothetical protein